MGQSLTAAADRLTKRLRPSRVIEAYNRPVDVRYTKEVPCRDRVVPVLIRRSRRKTLALHVFPDKPVELRAPLKCSWRTIDEFLYARTDWIAESLDAMAARDGPVAVTYSEGETHYFLGDALTLHCIAGNTKHVSVANDTLVVRSRAPEDGHQIKAAIEHFYRTQAVRLLPERIELCRERFDQTLPPTTLVIRKMRARWGSCSKRHEICLNSLLMQKSLTAIDFVVTHELCHLKHFAHNKSFYRLMDQVMPDWREREKLLISDKVKLQLDLF